MVNIANSAAKLISTTVNEKSGTTVKKFVTNNDLYGKKVLATVVEYGENNPLKKCGIDAFVKINGADMTYKEELDRILISGDEIILSGASKPANFAQYGDFSARFKEMINLLKQYPKLSANLIPNTQGYKDSQIIAAKLLNE